MLVITRREGEAFWLDQNVRVRVTRICGNQVRISIEAPKDVNVRREEVMLRLLGEGDDDSDA